MNDKPEHLPREGEIIPVYTVADLRDDLSEFPDSMPVMIAVVKYPGEFAIRWNTEGEVRWDTGTDVEVCPLEKGDGSLNVVDNLLLITVELEEYNAERHALSS